MDRLCQESRGTDMANLCDNSSRLRPAEHRPVDELANFITHGLGFFLSVAAAALLMSLVIHGREPMFIAACGSYSLSLIALYAASTLSHTFHDLAWRRFFRTLDQACIYLLIAGSFTPFAAVFLRHGWWPLLVIAMWVLAFFGVVLVLYMRNLTPGAKITYGLLGWLPIVSLQVLFDAAPIEILTWLLAGGLFYSVGTVFLRFDQRVRYFHALWHTCVIAGSICHYIAILLILLV
jgi:hemolysin III